MCHGRSTKRWTTAACAIVCAVLLGGATIAQAQELPDDGGAGDGSAGEEIQGPDDEADELESTSESVDDEVDGDDDEEIDEELEETEERLGLDSPALPDVDLEAPEDADPELEAQLESYRRAYERYAATIDHYQQAIDSLVQTEFARRRAEIDAAYDPQIRQALAVESEQRHEAVESLEQFLEQFPADPDYTPDAVFRLAILYDRLEEEEYQQGLEEWRQLNQAAREDDEVDAPPAPERKHDRSRALFEEIVNEWPDYRGIDLAYYFLFNLEWRDGNRPEARGLAQRLVNEAPDSRFVPEAHLIIGEYYFEEAEAEGRDNIRDRLKLARDGYEKAATEEGRQQMTETKYVQAVYSLAWSHYRLEHFPEALDAFRVTVEVIDDFARISGESRTALRDDSLSHMAHIMTMDWDLASDAVADYTLVERVEAYLDDGDDYEREVLELLGEQLMDLTRYDDAIVVYERILDQDPMHPDNPTLHRRLVVALAQSHRDEEAVAVRRELIDYYGEGSSWYEHQQRMGNEGAIREMEQIVRDYLLAAATSYHTQAEDARSEAAVRHDAELDQRAHELYEMAADSYQDFLRQFPNDPEIFQWNYQYADALYNSRRFDEAFEQYQRVRELDIPDNPFQENSARRAVMAIELAIQERIERGELSTPLDMGGDTADAAADAEAAVEQEREFDEDEVVEQIRVEGEEIPAVVMDWVTAMDRYVVLRLEADEQEHAGAIYAFHAADAFHTYEHYDESRRRFEWLVNEYSDHEVAYLAGLRILASFRNENDFEGLAEWAEELEGVIEGDQAEAIQSEVREYRLRASFQAGADMEDEGRLEEAAEQYAFLAREAPEHEQAPLALHNAARIYVQLNDRESAIEQYEKLFREYSDHDLSTRAVYRVAELSQDLFHYEKAVTHYRMFYDEFSGPTPSTLQEMDFDIEDRREESLFRTAHMNMYLQRYVAAAETAEEFFEAYPDSANSPDLLWQASEAWGEAGDEDQKLRVINQYINEYEEDSDHVERIFGAYREIAAHHGEGGDEQAEYREYEAIVERFDERWGGGEAQAPAGVREIVAESQFLLVERKLEEWDTIAIEGNLQQQQDRLRERLEQIEDLVNSYNEVTDFGRMKWILASYYRIGNIFHRMADALYAVEPPFEEGSMEYWDYRDAIDQEAWPLEDRSIEFYSVVVREARDNQVVNEWTRRAWESMHEQQEEVYPLYEDGHVPSSERIQESMSLMSYDEYQRRQERQDADDAQMTEGIETEVTEDEDAGDDIDPDVDPEDGEDDT